MFKIGDILVIKEEKKGRYTGKLTNQSYEILSIENTSLMAGHHRTTLYGLKDNDIQKIDLEFLGHIFNLDVELTRQLKLNKICSRLETR